MTEFRTGSNVAKMNFRDQQRQRLGDRVPGADRNLGTSYSGEPLNPIRARSAAYSGGTISDIGPEQERLLRKMYPESPKSKGKR